jgi:3-oxoacyl-[acyl-carrier-protein] synthase II
MTGNGANPGVRRVVITGMGAITPLGLDLPSSWANCREGKGGVAEITLFDTTAAPVRIAAEVKGFDAAEALGRKEARRSSRFIHFAQVASREAVTDAGLDVSAEPDEVGVIIGSGIGGLDITERASIINNEAGWRRVSPFTVPSLIPDMAAGMVAIDVGAKGVNFCVVSACATGGHSIGEAAEVIRRGDAVAMIAGGTEAGITSVGISAFASAQALSMRNDDPERASRPFDLDRDGFVTGEGAAIVVLEDLDHARARGARIHGELVGYGANCDANHITQPCADGEGAIACIQRALRKAGRRPDEVGYVNAHGTSTQLNDAAETLAFKAVFGDAAYNIPVSSTKSMTGHMLGAAGAFEAIVCLLAMRDRYLPPTINLETSDPACDLDYVPNVGRAAAPTLCVSTSFGFGGHNSALALAAYEEGGRAASTS